MIFILDLILGSLIGLGVFWLAVAIINFLRK